MRNIKKESIKYYECDKFGDMNPTSITPFLCVDLEALWCISDGV